MNQEKIGQFIKLCRKDKGMTQQNLADKLGITDRAISKWENGRCMPDISLLEQLTNELGITINELLSGEKLSNEQYKENAEQNLLMLVKNSSFNLNEKMSFFYKKWIKEHVFELVVEFTVLIILMIFGFFKDNGLQIISIILLFIWLFFQLNRLQKYVKENICIK